MSIDKLKTKFFTGAWLPDSKHYFKKINELIDRINGIGNSGDGSYKEYVALMSQDGTSVPTAIVLSNTLGVTVTFIRVTLGSYTLVATAMFTNYNKVFIQSFGNCAAGASLYLPIVNGSSGTITGYYTIATNNENSLNIYVYDNAGTSVDFSSLIDPANQIPLNIKVYN